MIDVLPFLPGERIAVASADAGGFYPEVMDVSEFDTWLAGVGDKDAWVTGNPVKPGVSGRPKATDIVTGRVLLVDVDPVKDAGDPEGLEAWKREAAADLAFRIWGAVGERGAVVDSGRGTQVWLRVERDVNRPLLLKWITATFTEDGAKIDATADLGRLMRCPGSRNSRTGCVVAVIAPGDTTPISPADVNEWTYGFTPPDDVRTVAFAEGAPSYQERRRWIRGDARKVWELTPEETLDTSKRDWQLVVALLRDGCPDDTVCRLLFAMPDGKATGLKGLDRRKGYWEATVTSALKFEAGAAQKRKLIADLPALAAADPEAPFRAPVLAALAELRGTDPPKWQGVRAALKASARVSGFKIGDLENAVRAAASTKREPAVPPDKLIRYLVDVEGIKVGWKTRCASGQWIDADTDMVRTTLRAVGTPPEEVDELLHAMRDTPWIVTSVPFSDRMLDGRRWNMSRAQWAVEPEPGPHPTWDQVFRVIGRGLDPAVLKDSWCQKTGIETGGDYLLYWFASMAQFPFDPTAYLFLVGEERVGKSMLHETVGNILLTGGYTMADEALVNPGGFNGELEGAVLCAVEETNLGRARGVAVNRLKANVTNPLLKIHDKGSRIRSSPNSTHWIQTANNPGYGAVFPGDTRVTMWWVEPPMDDEKLSKVEINDRCRDEAPAFLHTLLTLEIPKTGDGRLRVPAIETAAKRQQQGATTDLLSLWLKEHPEWVLMSDAQLTTGFRVWIEATWGQDTRYWTRPRVFENLPHRGERLRTLVAGLRRLAPWKGTSTELGDALGLEQSSPSIGLDMAGLDALIPEIVRGATKGSTTWSVSPF